MRIFGTSMSVPVLMELKIDALHLRGHAHRRRAETGRGWWNLPSFSTSSVKPMRLSASGLTARRFRWRRKHAALRGAQDVRRAVEEDEVVVGLDRRELLLEHDVGRPLRVALYSPSRSTRLNVVGTRSRPGSSFSPFLPSTTSLMTQVLHLRLAGIEDRVDEPTPVALILFQRSSA
jgi:hypothetical protein